MKKKKLVVGMVFLVPLRDSGYAAGVLARYTGKGDGLGYFFGPRIFDPENVDCSSFQAGLEILVGMFGDLDLHKGTWPIIGMVGDEALKAWPVPKMARVDEAADLAWVSTYDDDLRLVKEEKVSPSQVEKYHYDRMMGPGSVEIRLTKLLK